MMYLQVSLQATLGLGKPWILTRIAPPELRSDLRLGFGVWGLGFRV